MSESRTGDMDRVVSAWRTRVSRTSSLSVCELDELEDHLRARALLEMEFDVALTPQRAVRLAAEELGETRTLAREFVHAGRPRWRRLIVAGWGLWAVACALPLSSFGGRTVTSAELLRADLANLASRGSLTSLLGLLAFALLNVPMVLTLCRFRNARPRIGRLRMATWLVTANALGVLVIGSGFVMRWLSAGATLSDVPLGSGWWLYTASLACVAAAMWMRLGDARPLGQGHSRKQA